MTGTLESVLGWLATIELIVVGSFVLGALAIVGGVIYQIRKEVRKRRDD